MADDLKSRIQDDVKGAMRARDRERLNALRLITAAIKQKEVDDRLSLDDGAVIGVLEKMIKQRRDSIEQYQKAGRDELAAREAYEIEVIEAYMPAAMDDEEVEALIDAALKQTGASGMKDMGRVMGVLKARIQGRADMGAVSARVKARLGG
ncbi:MAG TPA: GatB/YqeY domain-containing protein [Gammaproteobacteria bacterium]|nr:GatB/YqeY domain-containing protein [Gammaproteobacteria bacterium]